MLQSIQIDTLFESLQAWMENILEMLGVLLVFLIFVLVIKNIPRILDPLKNVCKKWFLGWFICDNPFATFLAKGFFHVFVGIVIVFYAATLTGALYDQLVVEVKKDSEITQGAYDRLEKIENLKFTLAQQEWAKTLSSILEYTSVVFVLLLIIAGIFFMLGSIAPFFQKIAYIFFSLCFFWYLLSISWLAYISLSELVAENSATAVVQAGQIVPK